MEQKSEILEEEKTEHMDMKVHPCVKYYDKIQMHTWIK